MGKLTKFNTNRRVERVRRVWGWVNLTGRKRDIQGTEKGRGQQERKEGDG